MSSRLQKVITKRIIKDYPSWISDNIHYEVMMGSQSYGVSQDDSDMDIYGFVIPPKELLFPHLSGEIEGFGTSLPRFYQFQQHHVKDGSQEYDFTIYNIVKYFDLVMENNPNMIDSLFVPVHCILHITKIGQMVRDARKSFLHKGAWHKFRGYAFAQMSKIDGKVNSSNPKRAKTISEFGFDVKFAYHVVRLIDEVEQILMFGDIDLQRNREHLKAIRRGEVSLEEIKKWFAAKEIDLEKLYHSSSIPNSPDEAKIKNLLVNCLEEHYGSLKDIVKIDKDFTNIRNDIDTILRKYGL